MVIESRSVVAAPPKTLAVVLSGQVRTFVAPPVLRSVRAQLLDALCAPRLGGPPICAIELFLCAIVQIGLLCDTAVREPDAERVLLYGVQL